MGSRVRNERRLYQEVWKELLMTQCEMVVRYMQECGSITTLEAFELGITRLASRIHDLSVAGYDIERELVRTKNRYGEPVRYTKYSLKR